MAGPGAGPAPEGVVGPAGGTSPPDDGQHDGRPGSLPRGPGRIVRHLLQRQHRNAYVLMLNAVVGAGAGLGFWLVITRVLGEPPATVGIGLSIITLATAIGLLAKGGFDTAVVRMVPAADRDEGIRVLRFAVLCGGAVAVALAAVLGAASLTTGALPQLGWSGWALVAAIAVLLVVTWLQDAHFLASGDARPSLHRNVVLAGSKVLLPVPLVLLAAPHLAAVAWAMAVGASALFAVWSTRRIADRQGTMVPRRGFVRVAMHNLSGTAAEFLPGLLLVPLVLMLSDAGAAGHFGIAWSVASMLFLFCAAISRSALAEMSRTWHRAPSMIRRAARQHVWTVVPAAAGVLLLAPVGLALFGPEYVTHATLPLRILAASVVFVAPVYLYLAYLRARGHVLPLVVFPLGLMAALFAAVPFLEPRWGLTGVAAAWCIANAPFAAYGAWQLRRAAHAPGRVPDRDRTMRREEVMDGPLVDHRAHAE